MNPPTQLVHAHDVAVITAVNDEEILRTNLAASPLLGSGEIALLLEKGHKSASSAYNAAIDRSNADVLVFAHQDVYFPNGWDRQLRTIIAELETKDPNWGVIGPFGVTSAGKCVGKAWSSGLQKVVGEHISSSEPVVSFDEIVLVVRRASGIRFDPLLPGFHLYGTDIAQTSLAAKCGVYAFHAPVIHNSRPIYRLDSTYRKAYRYMQKKWRSQLPIPTSVMTITASGWPLQKEWLRSTIKSSARSRGPSRERHANPEQLAHQLGFC